MSTATTGRNAEWFVRDKFVDAGCEVIRAAGSKGKADLIATIPSFGVLYYLNVKINSWPGSSEMEVMQNLAAECVEWWHVIIYRRDNRRGWRMRLLNGGGWAEGPAWWPNANGSSYEPKVEPIIKSSRKLLTGS